MPARPGQGGRQMDPKKTPAYEKKTTRLPQTTNLFSGRRDCSLRWETGQGFEKKSSNKKTCPPWRIFAELFFLFPNSKIHHSQMRWNTFFIIIIILVAPFKVLQRKLVHNESSATCQYIIMNWMHRTRPCAIKTCVAHLYLSNWKGRNL